MRGVRILAIMMALVVAACYSGPDASHYGALLDELTISAGWELVRTEVRAPDGDDHCSTTVSSACPAVVRYYFVDDEPIDILAQAESMTAAAGYEIDEEFDPECDGRPSAPACVFYAGRDSDQLTVNIHSRGHSAGAGAEKGLAAIRITAEARLK